MPFNDEAAAEAVFDRWGDEIAAVLTEPMLGNTGVVLPEDGYHETLRSLCDEHSSLLVFDEVITGFRVGGLACAQGRFGIEPDLTTFGKVIGGGFPIGAIGGRAEVMQSMTPAGDVFQSGTFSGHPVTMAAGLETLRHAAETDVYAHVNALGERLREGLRDVVEDRAPEYTVVGTDSVFKVIFTRPGRTVRNAADVEASQLDRWERLFRPAMKERGIFLPANGKEAQFVCAAHTEADVDDTIEAYDTAL